MLPRTLRRSLVTLAALTTPVYTQNNASQEPCAQLSSLATNDATFFPANVALSCLRSVPLAKAGDLVQLQGLRAFLEFQSDLEYLKDPTIGRIYPGVDILAGLDKLTSLLEDDAYDNEYDFQTDVSRIFSSAYDGHLAYVPDITAVFAFGRLHTEDLDDSGVPSYFSLISITTGDNVTPEVYAYMVQINGEDILSWLNSYASQDGRSQDPDANYNQLFVNIPALLYQGVETNYFALSRYYQGDNTVLRFANETTRDVITRAQLLFNATLEGLTDGASFFERFCNKNLTETILAQASSSSSQTTLTETQVPFEPVSTKGLPPPHPAYPDPIAISSDNSVAGYLSESISELAILAIPSFTTSSPIEFENVVRQLLATASENNRTKLVIDFRGNSWLLKNPRLSRAVITAAPISDQLEFVTKFGIDFVQATTQALSRAAPGGAVIVQASLNFRNNIRQGDDSVTPLQHIYEAADCRFFYTPEMYASQAAVWERAYNSTWGDMECIEGSTEHPSSVSGGSDVTAGPPGMASNFFGGNNTIFLGEQLASALLVNSTSGNSTDTVSGAGSTAGNNGAEGGQGSGDSEGGSTYVSVPTVFATFMALGPIMLSTY
ncbi:hypothetical protein E4T38_03677 [Aureobasidium subglaciale]|nr:hypothetical protein E4T38_03677 [Aureobasidium subglaciale]KAI5224991.1 hypothetical protein E4T41_05425 [Aureobasidium subglaciale]KAI5225432.1 hypothetical protein E4T40_03452 [Aureobasidium subglaciale]KAI5261118.1 hypothetical protein E4T46_05318 [Aureobasidium subglaciale]